MIPHPCPAWSYQSAPPRMYLLALNAPQAELPLPPQNVLIEEAAGEDLNSTLKYAIEAAEFPEVASNAMVLVDAAVQYLRPSSAAASPNPIRGVRITSIFEALIGAGDIIPIFEAP